MDSRVRHRLRPRVEALESLLPLSGAAATLHAAIGLRDAAPIVQRLGQAIALQGTARGGYLLTRGNPDTGATYQIVATGQLTPVGRTTETGRIQTTGFILSGTADGTMTVSGSRGSLKLSINGPVQPGFSSLPATVSYTIVGGTRAYQNAVGSGSIGISINSSFLSSRVGRVTLVFHT